MAIVGPNSSNISMNFFFKSEYSSKEPPFLSSRKENAVNKKESTRGRAQKMEGIFKVVKSSEVSFRKKKFQNELQHQSRRREMKSSKVEEGLLSRSMLGFQDVQNAKWFYKFFSHLCLEFEDV